MVLTDEQRDRRLEQELQRRAVDGWHVERYVDRFSVVISRRRRVNHVLHAILSVLTLGLWLFVWLALVAFGGGTTRTTIRVDEVGHCGPLLPPSAQTPAPRVL